VVSLGSLLTPQRLQSLAGYGYERGERYARQGHVVACELKGEVLEGIVAGSMRNAEPGDRVRLRNAMQFLHQPQ